MVAGRQADKWGRRRWMMAVTVGIMAFGALMPACSHGTPGSVLLFIVIGMALMGCTFGPMAAALA